MRAELERLRRWVRDEQYTFRRNPDLCSTYRGVGDRINAILTRSDWIPVSERLPPEGRIVDLTFQNGDGHRSVSRAYVDRAAGVWCWASGGTCGVREEVNLMYYTPVAWKQGAEPFGGWGPHEPIEEPAPYRAEWGGG